MGRMRSLSTWTTLGLLAFACSSSLAQDPVPAQFVNIVNAHSDKRAIHLVPALSWSNTIAASAAAFVANCDGNHDDAGLNAAGLGENLYFSGGSDVTAALDAAVCCDQFSWYSELSKYDFNSPESPNNVNAGHFTQLVWKSSTLVGCAAQFCPTLTNAGGLMSGVIVSCRYSPRGNVQGQFADNVNPPSGSAVDNSTSPSPGPNVTSPSPEPGTSPEPSPEPTSPSPKPQRSPRPPRPHTSPSPKPHSSPSPSPSPGPVGNFEIEILQGKYLKVHKNSLAVLVFIVKEQGEPVCPDVGVVKTVEISAEPTACPAYGPGYKFDHRTAPSYWGYKDPSPVLYLGSQTCNPETKVSQYVFYTWNRPVPYKPEPSPNPAPSPKPEPSPKPNLSPKPGSSLKPKHPKRKGPRGLLNTADGGYPNGGYPDGGSSIGGYPNGGYSDGSYPNGGSPDRGYSKGGYPNNGYSNGGYSNGGYPNDGYSNGGYQDGNYGKGGYPGGGYPGGHHEGGYDYGVCFNADVVLTDGTTSTIILKYY